VYIVIFLKFFLHIKYDDDNDDDSECV